MSVEITVPSLGESIVEATVGRWMKAEGDSVAEGEPVVELETEKVNMEVVAPAAGTLQSIAKHEGDTVGIGEVLGLVGKGQAAPASSATGGKPASSKAAQPAAPASSAPTEPVGASGGRPQPAVASTAPVTAIPEYAESGRATPLARRIADERGIDLQRISGTGTGGRVTHEDVAAYIAAQGNGAGAPAATSAATSTIEARPAAIPASLPTGSVAPETLPAQPQPAQAGPVAQPSDAVSTAYGRREERVRMSRRRQTIARRLVEAKQSTAMLTTFNEVDMSAIMELRKRRKDAFKERHGVGLGYMSFFTRAVVGALKAFPRLNAEIQGNEMVLKRYYDIGIAVSTDEGLVVPVLRDADRMTFAEIEQSIAALATKARNGELTLEDLQGGTFTITNGGTFGSLLSTPILNSPQVGILGMHKIEERPIALNGQVVIHPMMYVAVSYDHRIVDGAESVSFLVRVKQLLEDPETLLLEG